MRVLKASVSPTPCSFPTSLCRSSSRVPESHLRLPGPLAAARDIEVHSASTQLQIGESGGRIRSVGSTTPESLNLDANSSSGVDLLPKPASKPTLETTQRLQLSDMLKLGSGDAASSTQEFIHFLEEAAEASSGPLFSPGRSWQTAIVMAITVADKVRQQHAAGLQSSLAAPQTTVPSVVYADGQAGLSAASALQAAIAASEKKMATGEAHAAVTSRSMKTLSGGIAEVGNDEREMSSSAATWNTTAVAVASVSSSGSSTWQINAESSSTDSDWEDIIWNPSWQPGVHMNGYNRQPLLGGTEDVWEDDPVASCASRLSECVVQSHELVGGPATTHASTEVRPAAGTATLPDCFSVQEASSTPKEQLSDSVLVSQPLFDGHTMLNPSLSNMLHPDTDVACGEANKPALTAAVCENGNSSYGWLVGSNIGLDGWVSDDGTDLLPSPARASSSAAAATQYMNSFDAVASFGSAELPSLSGAVISAARSNSVDERFDGALRVNGLSNDCMWQAVERELSMMGTGSDVVNSVSHPWQAAQQPPAMTHPQRDTSQSSVLHNAHVVECSNDAHSRMLEICRQPCSAVPSSTASASNTSPATSTSAAVAYVALSRKNDNVFDQTGSSSQAFDACRNFGWTGKPHEQASRCMPGAWGVTSCESSADVQPSKPCTCTCQTGTNAEMKSALQWDGSLMRHGQSGLANAANCTCMAELLHQPKSVRYGQGPSGRRVDLMQLDCGLQVCRGMLDGLVDLTRDGGSSQRSSAVWVLS